MCSWQKGLRSIMAKICREQREKGAVFRRLGELVKSMMDFDLDPEDAKQLALQFCKGYHLTIKQIDDLNVHSRRHNHGDRQWSRRWR